MEKLVLVVGGGSLGAHILGDFGMTISGDTLNVHVMGCHFLQTPMEAIHFHRVGVGHTRLAYTDRLGCDNQLGVLMHHGVTQVFGVVTRAVTLSVTQQSYTLPRKCREDGCLLLVEKRFYNGEQIATLNGIEC